MIIGQDWSSYQPMSPSTKGLSFAFTKVTEGLNYVNPRWVSQRNTAKKAGLVWGAYHYPHMGNDPIREARFFLDQVLWQPGDLVVLDWEGYDSYNKGVPKSKQLAYRDAWLKFVKSQLPNNRVGMYCNTDYWKNVDKTSNCGDFLWIADYGHPAGKPAISYAWTFHQYTDKPVDTNVARFNSKQELMNWAHMEEDDVALSDDDVKKIADAVWAKTMASPTAAKGTDPNRAASTFLRWQDKHYADEMGAIAALDKKVAALTATVTKLAGMVGQNVDTATVVKAVQDAIAKAVIDVDVTVNDKPEATA